MFKWVTFSAAILSGTLLASQAGAVTKDLVGINPDGTTFSSGWQYSVADNLAPDLNLVFIRKEGNDFFLEKDVTIRHPSDAVVITFTKTSATANNLVINDEAVNNQSGLDWIGFRFTLSSGTTAPGTTPFYSWAFRDAGGGLSQNRGDFRIDPFTAFHFENDAQDLIVDGGTVANGSTWFPGAQSDTSLAIVASANASNTFTLKEIPIPIPLPAAAWTGLTGLVGLALARATKRARV
jgi:hypothetical protein